MFKVLRDWMHRYFSDEEAVVLAVLLFLMPMYAIRRVPSMRKYSGAASNVFVVVVGLVALTSVVYGLLG